MVTLKEPTGTGAVHIRRPSPRRCAHGRVPGLAQSGEHALDPPPPAVDERHLTPLRVRHEGAARAGALDAARTGPADAPEGASGPGIHDDDRGLQIGGDERAGAALLLGAPAARSASRRVRSMPHLRPGRARGGTGSPGRDVGGAWT